MQVLHAVPVDDMRILVVDDRHETVDAFIFGRMRLFASSAIARQTVVEQFTLATMPI